jgi:adenylate cyclase
VNSSSLKPVEEGLGIKGWLRGPRKREQATKKGETKEIAGRERIAILPFVNISPDPKDEYFADGMTEELISTLSKIHPLKVISRTSVMRYKQTLKSVQEISKELNAGSILEGSVRKAADELRITVKLIDVENDEHVWSQDYERKVENVFAVQKEIAKNVVESLQLELLPRDKRRLDKQDTSNVEAYELYLKGRFLWNKRSKDSMIEAIEFFRASAKKDPSFALPHVGIADCYSLLAISGYLSGEEGYPKAKQAIAKALELDESLAEAHASMGLIKSDADWDWIAAEREYRRAVELNPGYATAHQWLSILLGATLGRVQEGLAEAKKALELDPLSPAINLNIGSAYLVDGELALAEKHIRRALELEPSYVDGFVALMLLAVERRSYSEAIDILEKMRTMFPSGENKSKISIAYVYARSGDLGKAKQVFEDTLRTADKGSITPIDKARYYVGVRDWDSAFEMLDRAFELHDAELCTVGMDPWLRDLSADPRFEDFLRKMKVR